MRVISYNLRKHAARNELEQLVETYTPNLLCLQEVDTADLPRELGPLHLADSTRLNRLGLAIFYNRERFDALSTKAFALKRSLHDIIAKPAHERLLGTHLIDRDHDRELVVGCFHAAPLTALNSLRRTQIRAAHEALDSFGPTLPTLMVGDFNYPIFKDHLSTSVQETGHEVTLSDSRTYTRYKFFRGHFDFATSIGLTIIKVTTLPQGQSDHLPILVTANYADSVIEPVETPLQ
ncbi:MAG: endonuclease/exonuclease/phosphatase family protein [Microcella sp.]|uniref:endonuclease/exonuclease/phosphatase family protein n=1 Tax=Microcella sp. TaxID=1913979 RepID=UPI0024C7F351|nr:endonuclease/exonuclease/phosphatase family protein [Microcella sp.]UYN83790.1 MAG: endonuclease/exonuclease/phosphatase family protein [Microcella sp.]